MPRSSGRGIDVIEGPRLSRGLLDDVPGGDYNKGGSEELGAPAKPAAPPGEWAQGLCTDMFTGARAHSPAPPLGPALPLASEADRSVRRRRLRLLRLPVRLRRAGGGAQRRQPPRAARGHRHVQHVPLRVEAVVRLQGRPDVRGGRERHVLLRLLPLRLRPVEPRAVCVEAQARRRVLRGLCVAPAPGPDAPRRREEGRRRPFRLS